jgi:hypothetical protein
MKIKILSHQEFAGAILKKPTEEVKLPLSEENNQMKKIVLKYLSTLL